MEKKAPVERCNIVVLLVGPSIVLLGFIGDRSRTCCKKKDNDKGQEEGCSSSS
ncbi:hypothetical protein OUZ56_021635 [Daphnia magna]|uniref:Transmembrane protein n=1 Tax=Daphnia magna TaxID=35525 RepID=A0ABR0AU94_9CRUS|nr:hypothetical protein OUZ56_021635 [Daphnia magna]